MNFENGKLYVIHDQLPKDKIEWNLYIPELFYFWNGKKYKINNRSPSWTEGIIKKKPIGIYKIDNKVPSSISSQILSIIQKQENKTMTERQKKLVENYIRRQVKARLAEQRLDENLDIAGKSQLLTTYINSLSTAPTLKFHINDSSLIAWDEKIKEIRIMMMDYINDNSNYTFKSVSGNKFKLVKK